MRRITQDNIHNNYSERAIQLIISIIIMIIIIMNTSLKCLFVTLLALIVCRLYSCIVTSNRPVETRKNVDVATSQIHSNLLGEGVWSILLVVCTVCDIDMYNNIM